MRAVTHGVPTSFWSGTAIASSHECEPHEVAVWRPCHDGYARCDELVRFGAVPHTSAGAEPSRGARRNYYQGAALHLASCPVHRRATGIAADQCSAGRTRNAIGAAGHIEYRHGARFAQPLCPEYDRTYIPTSAPLRLTLDAWHPRARPLMLRSNHPILSPVSVDASRRDSATRRRASSRMRRTAAWCSSARGSSSSNCASASSAVSGLLKAC